ncbi:ABC transporter permease [Clostridium sp. SYSU_GA19001]|uniref:ABC transporter permease n=1 Tax=Clostridium caldaquaticum TaxID=2940653 RepID=UPI0020773A7E|nr:ABC transporter permease [Clostridium caldaquaticum]MCM8709962.1 ABC transporter permease [Clostridium caldaquaticum]
MKKRIKFKENIAFAAFLVLFIVFTITSKFTLISPYNLKTIIDQTIQTIIGGLGVIFIIAMGSTDLSISGIAAVSATIGCLLVDRFGFWIMIPSTIIIGLAIGLMNGIIISKFKVSSFMCTLAMLIALKGILYYFISDSIIFTPVQLTNVNKLSYKVIILAALILVLGYIFEFTKLGRYCRAMGENETTAKSIGIDTNRVRVIAFVLSGFTASLVGIIQMANLGGASASMGQFMEMKVMMAIFLGGVLVTGGFSAKIYKLLIGAFTMTIIVNGLQLSGVKTEYSEAVEGVLLMIVLFATIYFNNKKMSSLNL